VFGIGCLDALACSRPVELKRDTPQATVATYVKLYDKKDYVRLDLLIDGLGERAEARQNACLADTLKSIRCNEEFLRCYSGGRYNAGCTSEECRGFSKTNCTCRGAGKTAAEGAPKYTKTRVHEVMTGMKLSPDTCKIESVEKTEPAAVGGNWNLAKEYNCGDLGESDQLQIVTFECAGASSMRLLLRERSRSWLIVGFDAETKLKLSLSRSPTDVTNERKQKEDLNKDMR
jgi:hypothetical protein